MDVQKRSRPWLWILVVAAVFIAAWVFRVDEDGGASNAQLDADRVAAVDADPDDILVDLGDNVTSAQVATLEHDLGITLTLVDSIEAPATRLYRAHVDASREAAVLAALATRP